MMFQPLTGPGFTVNKPAVTLEQLRAEIERRIAGIPSARSFKLPAIIPADRGRGTANWTVENWLGVPAEVQAVIIAVMKEFEVEG
jgi:hypothetical protein